jgi:hypothetical protein
VLSRARTTHPLHPHQRNEKSMNQHTIRQNRFLLLAILMLMVALAASAAATRAVSAAPSETPTGGLEHVTQTVGVSPVSSATATATCPDNSVAVDGGVVSDPGLTRITASTATDEGSGWQVQLWNQHPSRGLTAHVWAACLALG